MEGVRIVATRDGHSLVKVRGTTETYPTADSSEEEHLRKSLLMLPVTLACGDNTPDKHREERRERKQDCSIFYAFPERRATYLWTNLKVCVMKFNRSFILWKDKSTSIFLLLPPHLTSHGPTLHLSTSNGANASELVYRVTQVPLCLEKGEIDMGLITHNTHPAQLHSLRFINSRIAYL